MTCTFKNTGKTAWPANVQLKLDNGTVVVYNALGLEKQCVQPNEELNVTIEVNLPNTSGRYDLKLRLVHGDNQEFGDEATVKLVAQAATVVPTETLKPVETQTSATEQEDPVIETAGNSFTVDQDRNNEDMNESDGNLDLSVNSETMFDDDVGDDVDMPSEPSVKYMKVATSGASVAKVVALSEVENQRNSYNEQVCMSRYKEKHR